jgi:CRP/FNR family transcriptional regulator, anaerobic regulatory protein
MTINPSEYIERCLKVQLDEEVKDLLNAQSTIVTFHKGEHPVREGDKMDSFYFLIYGLVRGYFIDKEGNSVTKCFSCEKQFFSAECFRTNEKSSLFVECLEESKCIKIPYSLVRKLEDLTQVINKLYLDEIARLDGRVKELFLLNAEERYINFCREYPDLQDRVPLKYIASYIGIQAGSMSRIRRKLKNRF